MTFHWTTFVAWLATVILLGILFRPFPPSRGDYVGFEIMFRLGWLFPALLVWLVYAIYW